MCSQVEKRHSSPSDCAGLASSLPEQPCPTHLQLVVSKARKFVGPQLHGMSRKCIHDVHHGHAQRSRPVERAHEQEARAVEEGDWVDGLEGGQHIFVDDAVGIVHLGGTGVARAVVKPLRSGMCVCACYLICTGSHPRLGARTNKH